MAATSLRSLTATENLCARFTDASGRCLSTASERYSHLVKPFMMEQLKAVQG